DGKTLAFACHHRKVLLWRPAEKGKPVVLKGHTAIVFCVTFSPSGKLLATGSWDGTIKLWDSSSGKIVRTIGTAGSAVIHSVAFSRDGTTLAAGGDSQDVELWQVPEGKEKGTFKLFER